MSFPDCLSITLARPQLGHRIKGSPVPLPRGYGSKSHLELGSRWHNHPWHSSTPRLTYRASPLRHGAVIVKFDWSGGEWEQGVGTTDQPDAVAFTGDPCSPAGLAADLGQPPTTIPCRHLGRGRANSDLRQLDSGHAPSTDRCSPHRRRPPFACCRLPLGREMEKMKLVSIRRRGSTCRSILTLGSIFFWNNIKWRRVSVA